MWIAERPSARADTELARIVSLAAAETELFDPGKPLFVARAPSRLDVMGGIADYSGSLVLELPLSSATWVVAQAADEPAITVMSAEAAEIGKESLGRISLDAMTPGSGPIDYAEVRELFRTDPSRSWIAYTAGALVVLQHVYGRTLSRGARLFIHSDVPAGRGIASSAALEVASLVALAALVDVALDGRQIALLAQKVEHSVVGAPCGVMDQMTSACARRDHLLCLKCQPAEPEGHVAVPPDLELWGIDSGIRHEVAGPAYGGIRVGAFMGYRILAELAGLVTEKGEPGHVTVRDPLWGGYLANVAPSVWASRFRDRVPEELRGRAFLDKYDGLPDAVTEVDPERDYAVRACAEHPILENHRVRLFRSLLESSAPARDESRALLGELMYQSHASYGGLGLGSDGTDRLVALVREAGIDQGLYGAKITGGGSGGTVAVLARRGSWSAIESITSAYQAETGRDAAIFGGSSDGAQVYGLMRLTPA
jgi:L-arabinokinase